MVAKVGTDRKEQDASVHTLGLDNIWQVLRKLWWEILLLKETPDSLEIGSKCQDALHIHDAKLYAATNAACTCIALVDWLYFSIRDDDQLQDRAKNVLGEELDMRSDKKFLDSLCKLNLSLKACRHICNATKHYHLRNPKRDFKSRVIQGVFHRGDGRVSLSVSALIVQNGPGDEGRGPVDQMLIELLHWWEEKLTAIQVPDRKLFFPELDT